MPKLWWPLGLAMNRFALFHPSPLPANAATQRSRAGAQDVWVRTADGVLLNGWWASPPAPRWATLYLHGNEGNLTFYGDHVREIVAAGSAVLALDYRGFGASHGRPTEEGVYRDAEAGYRHLLKTGFPPARIVLHGESLGTAVAVHLACGKPCAGVILEAPFTSIPEVAAGMFPFLDRLVLWSFDSLSRIRNLRAPLLIIHGDRDRTVPFALGRRLFDEARQPKQLWRVAGAGHHNLIETAGGRYREGLREFYDWLSTEQPATGTPA